MNSLIRHFFVCLCAMFVFNAAASVAETDFDTANRLYGQGKFTEAAGAYEKLIQSGVTSGAIYFNLGDACFKAGRFGRAIVAYRQAMQLTPRDQDLRANLQFVRSQVSGPTLRTHRWQIWIDTLSLNEWTCLTVTAFWITFLLLAAKQWKPQWQSALRTYNTGALVLFLVFACGFGISLGQHLGKKVAIVTSHDANVLGSPFASQELFTVRDGAELQVLDQKDDWYQVSDGAERIGWLQRDSVSVVPSV